MRLILLVLLFGLLIASPATAQQPPCGPIDKVEAHLAAEFRETRLVQAVTDQGPMMVVYSAPDGATWTLVLIRPDRIACMMASGSGLQIRNDPAPVQEEGL